jgi:arsenite-transporting ATPase
VLIVSTDPASNLDAVLDTPLANQPRAVRGVPGLLAMNIDPAQAASDYRERTLGPYRGTASPAEFALLEERLSGACTVEVAAFDEFTLLLTEGRSTHEFEHVIFDTAPTGHTLRLLQLPAAWTGFLETGAAEESCIGPLSGLKAQQARYAETVRALGDPAQTLLVLVARPDRIALLEAARSSRELAALGMNNQHFVLNGVFRANDPGDALARAYERRAQQALAAAPDEIAALPRDEVPLRAFNVVGVERVRAFLSEEVAAPAEPLLRQPWPLQLSSSSLCCRPCRSLRWTRSPRRSAAAASN